MNHPALFKRKFYNKLLAWKKEAQGSRAILVEGARRVGKSTICEEFARREYQSYLLINFSNTTRKVKNIFWNHLDDLDTFFMLLQSTTNVRLPLRKSLIIFDEVQKLPRAREAIKHLVADGRYDYLETGSLISIRENVKDIVIPSEERHLKMYPLDFEEFCWALGQEQLAEYIKYCFRNQCPLEPDLHQQAMLVFKQYLLVGGMPQCVAAFLKGRKDFAAADKQKRDILTIYRDDIMKIKSRYRGKVLTIFDKLPGMLGRHEKKINFNKLNSGSTAIQYEDTFFWLANSMITNQCFLTTDPNVGLGLNKSDSSIKCFLSDTGLLVSHAFDETELAEKKIYQQILDDKLGLNKGMLYENLIAQMLAANGHPLFFYAHYNKEQHRNDIEVDFLLTSFEKGKAKVNPLEVKSSKNYTTNSLDLFRRKFKKRIGTSYIIHPRNLCFKDEILCIPPYMVMCL